LIRGQVDWTVAPGNLNRGSSSARRQPPDLAGVLAGVVSGNMPLVIASCAGTLRARLLTAVAVWCSANAALASTRRQDKKERMQEKRSPKSRQSPHPSKGSLEATRRGFTSGCQPGVDLVAIACIDRRRNRSIYYP
jgi:hypothetical protein